MTVEVGTMTQTERDARLLLAALVALNLVALSAIIDLGGWAAVLAGVSLVMFIVAVVLFTVRPKNGSAAGSTA